MNNMGVVLFKVTGTGSKGRRAERTRPVSAVREAALAAEIPEEFFRDIGAKSAFSRGMSGLMKRNLVEANFRDKSVDDENIVRFAFVARLPGMEYEATFIVDWNKQSENISIVKAPDNADQGEILEAAHKEIEKAKGQYNSADINRAIERFLSKQCRRIMLRDGVYFVPTPFEKLGKQVQKFFRALAITYMAYTIGYQKDDAETIHAAIVADMVKQVDDLKAQVSKAKSEGVITKRSAQGKINKIRLSIEHYKGLAMATKATMDDLFEAAGESGKILIDAALTPEQIMQRAEDGVTVAPVALDLFGADVDAYAETAVQQLRNIDEMPVLDGPDLSEAVI